MFSWVHRFIQTSLQTFGPMGSGVFLYLIASFVLPVRVATCDVRSLQVGTLIEVNRNSPVFSALLDLNEPVTHQTSHISAQKLPILTTDYSKWAKNIQLANRTASKIQQQLIQINLPQMVLAKNELGSTLLKASVTKIDSDSSLNPITELEHREIQEELTVSLASQNHSHLLPYAQEPKVLEAVKAFQASEPLLPDVSTKIRELISEEVDDKPSTVQQPMLSSQPMSNEMRPRSLTGEVRSPESIYLTPWSGGSADRSRATGSKLKGSVSKGQGRLGHYVAAALPTNRGANISSSGIVVASSNPLAAPQGFVEPSVGQESVAIKGFLQFEGGLAFMGHDYSLRVYREFEGRDYEQGQVWVRDGSFEIVVGQYQGELVAEVIDGQGNPLGRGIQSLDATPSKQRRVQGLEIKLRPVIDGVSGQVISAYSFSNYITAVPEATVSIEGVGPVALTAKDGGFRSKEVAQNSNFLLRVTAKGYWDTVTFSGSGQKETIRLYPEKLIAATSELIQLSDPETSITDERSVVWGTVTNQGQPLQGAVVEVAGDPEARILYFNEWMVVDSHLTATSKNGMFIVVRSDEGICSLRAKLGGAVTTLTLAPLRYRSVSTVDVSFAGEKVMTVSSFNAFDSGRPVPTLLEEVGRSEISQLDASGQLRLRTALGDDLGVFESQPEGTYLPSRQILSRRQNYIFLPQITSEWVQGVLASIRVNIAPQSGQVIGFVPDDDFVAYVDGQPIHSESGIYFDELGQPLPTQSHGIKGGGIFMFNLSPGFHTMSITTGSSGKIFLQTVYVEPKVLSTFYAKRR